MRVTKGGGTSPPGRRIAVTSAFNEALNRLDNASKKSAHTAVMELLTTPDSAGLNFEQLSGRAKKNGWSSSRAGRDVRIILGVHHDLYCLAWVDHHDAAYRWAESNVFRVHEGCAQIYVDPNIVLDAAPTPDPSHLRSATPRGRGAGDTPGTADRGPAGSGPPAEASPPFAACDDRYLLDLGVPPEWIGPVRALPSTNELEALIGKLPDPVWERLVDLAGGKAPSLPAQRELGLDPLEAPDARRTMVELASEADVDRLFNMQWEAWELFLHPEQRDSVEADHEGPCLIRGAAGTGKTVVAVHRAARLAREAETGRVLLTCYSSTLSGELGRRLRRLLSAEEDRETRARVDIVNVDRLLHKLGRELFELGEQAVTTEETQRALLAAAASRIGRTDGEEFLWEEWTGVVDFWGVDSDEAYRQASREGRKIPLPAVERARLWPIFAEVIANLRDQGRYTWAGLARVVTARLKEATDRRYAHVVVDEAQDLSPAQLAFLRALVAPGKNDLTLVADPGQQIFKRSFSWIAAGIDVRGRSVRLHWSYRNARTIAEIGAAIRGGSSEEDEARPIGARIAGRVSFRGTASAEDEAELVGKWITRLGERGVSPGEIAIFARTKNYLQRVGAAAAGRVEVPVFELRQRGGTSSGDGIAIGTMHNAKGLERRAVAVIGCSAGFVPLTRVLDRMSDPGERELALQRERNLLYVAATRAREYLLVTWVGEPSPFLPADRVRPPQPPS